MIKQISINHYKAINECKNLDIQPFSAFIGNNGSGKSSIIEALRTLHIAITNNLEAAFEMWGGLDKIRNYNAKQEANTNTVFGFVQKHKPIIIELKVELKNKIFDYFVQININQTGDYYVVEKEKLDCNGKNILEAEIVDNNGTLLCQYVASRIKDGDVFTMPSNMLVLAFRDGNPVFFSEEIILFKEFIENWQFLYLNAHTMGMPVNQSRMLRKLNLDYDGRNIAEFILWHSKTDDGFIESLIQKMRFVLPYLKDIQANLTETFNREIELLLYEQNELAKDPIPGWLLSSGTLRILALLAIFTQSNKPSVLFIDEIENGLDPRTIGLLLSEIESVFNSKEMQVVVTTHSPYLLDMIPLESVIVTEKTIDGSIYSIPNNELDLTNWKDKFSPGKLYTMGKLTK
jgi:predicted ATPase